MLILEDGGAAICEMLFASSLVAVVGSGDPETFSPRKLQIINTKVLLLNHHAFNDY